MTRKALRSPNLKLSEFVSLMSRSWTHFGVQSQKAAVGTTPFPRCTIEFGFDSAVYSAFFGPASITSSTVRRPALGELISTAMLPGGCWFFHIRVCAAGIFSQG